MEGYALLASPTLYSGQTVKTSFCSDQPTSIKLFITVYNKDDQLEIVHGPDNQLSAESRNKFEWTIPDTQSQPIAEIGIKCAGASGNVYLDYLTWDGEPDVVLTRPLGFNGHKNPPLVWRQAWVDAMDLWEVKWPQPYRLIQNEGCGLIMQGTLEWQDYIVEADITPLLIDAAGIAARVQGLKRFYALQLVKGEKIRLLKALDGDNILAEADFDWDANSTYQLKLQVSGNHILAWIDDELQFGR